MSGFEALDVHKYIEGLRNDAALKAMFPGGTVVLSADFAIREPPPFYLVFSALTNDDVNGMGGVRVMVDSLYQMQAVGRDVGFDVLRPVITRVDAYLSSPDTARQVGSTWVGRFVRQSSDFRSTWLDNIAWHYIEGIYKTVSFTYT